MITSSSSLLLLLLVVVVVLLSFLLLIRRVERRTTLTSAALTAHVGTTTACQGKKDTFLTEHCASTKRITKARAAHEHAAATDTALYCVGAPPGTDSNKIQKPHSLVTSDSPSGI